MIRSSGSRSIGKGLGNIEPEGTTLVAYAAKPGQTAEDGTGRNSPYASALIRNIQTPGLEINQVFRRVHDEVLAATGKRRAAFHLRGAAERAIRLQNEVAMPPAPHRSCRRAFLLTVSV